MAESKHMKEKNQNIQVFVRIRPINSREREIKTCSVIETRNTKEVLVRQGVHDKQTKKFTYDRVFGPDSKQREVYTAVVHPFIEEVLSGYSCTLFAYGQTGTGKTFTMAGGSPIANALSDSNLWQDDSMAGVIPRCLSHLFDELRLMQVQYTIRVSYLEIYNEELCDLLSPIGDTSKTIRIYDDPSKKGSVIVHGLEEIPVTGKDQVFKIMARGHEKRRIATTLMNKQSSRSHTIFTIILHVKENSIEDEEFIKSGKLNFVDLAGSENISKAGNDKHEKRAKEGVNINQSLLTLGRVITALVERSPHVPYRESKLTRLLKDSLGGRTKTSIIATISPGHKNLDETLSTLGYAYKAKKVQNKPEVNQKISQQVALKEYAEEIERIRRDLVANRDKNGVYLATETYHEITIKLKDQNRKITEKLLQIRAYEEEIGKRDEILKSLIGTLTVKTEKLKKTNEKLAIANNQLEITQKDLAKTKDLVVDKSHIIKKQVDSEEKLTLGTKALISVVEHAAHDANCLQDSVETRRYVDKQLKTTAQTFGDTLHQQCNQIETQTDTFIECQTTFANSVTQKLDEYTQVHQKSSKQLMNIMNSIKEDQLNRIAILQANIYELKYSFSGKELEHTQNMENKIESLIQLIHDFNNTNVTLVVDKLHNFFKTENNLLENINLTFNKQADQYLNRIQELSNKHKTFCTDFEKYVLNSYATQKSNLQRAVDYQTKIADNEAKYNKLMSAKLEEYVQTMFLLQKSQSNRNNSLKEELEKGTENLAEIQNETHNIERKISHTIRKNILDNESFIENCNDSQLNEIDAIDNLYLKLNKSTTTTAHKSFLDHLSKTTSTLINDATSGLKELKSCQKVVNETTVEELNRSVEENAKLLKATADIVKKSVVEQLNTIEEQTNSIVSTFSEQVYQQNVIQDEVSQFKTNSVAKVNTVRNLIDKYVFEDLKVYTPTGLTPVRKEYSFPRELAETSPQKRIFEEDGDSVVHLPVPTIPRDMNATAPPQYVSSAVPRRCKSTSEIHLKNLPVDKTINKENFEIPQLKKKNSDGKVKKILKWRN